MIIGTTPTFTLKLKRTDDVDLRLAMNVYVTLKQGNIVLTKTKSQHEINIVDAKTVQFSLTQAESLGFVLDKNVELQLNWTYYSQGETKRAATKIVNVFLEKQLLRQEIS